MTKKFYPTEKDYQDLEDIIVSDSEYEELEKDIVTGGEGTTFPIPLGRYPWYNPYDILKYTIPKRPDDYVEVIWSDNQTHNPCENCPNHLNNGGTGVCLCALPSMTYTY